MEPLLFLPAGNYPIPTTTYFNHPCIKMPRRTTMKGAPRFNPNPNPKDPKNPAALDHRPSPATYNCKDFYKILDGRPPQFTMRIKPKIGGNIFKSECATTAIPLDQDAVKYRPPIWSMRARTCKMLQLPGQTNDSIPGPGQYPVPATTEFNHPTLEMPGRTRFGHAPRFLDKDPDDP